MNKKSKAFLKATTIPVILLGISAHAHSFCCSAIGARGVGERDDHIRASGGVGRGVSVQHHL